MKYVSALCALLTICASASAEPAKRVPQEVLDRIKDDNPNPLPRSMTPAEQLLPLPRPSVEDMLRMAPPTGTVRTAAEYEQMEGLLIRWGTYNSVLTEMTVAVTTGDPDAIMYILVTGASQQASATSTLTSAGADMSQVEFITYVSDTVWIRDYGPRYMFEDGVRSIIDHTYNRPRPLDNAFNDYLSTLWGEPQYDIPLTHGGGNFHLFSTGDAFMSTLITQENPGLSEQDVKDLFLAYENLDLTIYTGFPTSFDSTRHIDMWMFPVRDDEIIIGEYSSSTGQPYTITEGAVADLTARGYTVYRTPGWNSGGTHYTYTNAVVINDLVLVPRFAGSWATQDATAFGVFETAFYDRQCVPIYCGSIIHAAGAIHCIVMHVPLGEQDCNGNGIPDDEDIANCTGEPACSDCNGNAVPDECDITSGTSADCNLDGIPDECQLVGNDCDGNGVPDECDVDCDGNAIPDACDIADCAGDPACDDCNFNGVPDGCDLTGGGSTDDNANGIPDECEVVAPLAEDSVATTCTIDDDCPTGAVCVGSVCYVKKNRYISIDPNPANDGHRTARRVAVDLGGRAMFVIGWLGAPQELTVSGPETSPQLLARIVDFDSRHYRDWSVDDTDQPWTDATLHVGDCETSPGHTYVVEAISEGLDPANPANYSEPLVLMTTELYGDVVGAEPGTAPDGTRNFKDISSTVRGFQGTQSEPKVCLDLQGPTSAPEMPDFSDINFKDIDAAVAGFQGGDYLLPQPCDCPGQVCP